jgi:hypothetical protein
MAWGEPEIVQGLNSLLPEHLFEQLRPVAVNGRYISEVRDPEQDPGVGARLEMQAHLDFV